MHHQSTTHSGHPPGQLAPRALLQQPLLGAASVHNVADACRAQGQAQAQVQAGGVAEKGGGG